MRWGSRSLLGNRRFCLVVVTAVLLVAGCTPSSEAPSSPRPDGPQRGGRIEIGVVGEPATLDPHAPNASDLTFALVRPVFPMPYRLLPDGTTEPDLAESLEVRGDRALLTLRQTSWSDGRAITAQDVVASIERAAPPSGFAATEARVLRPRVVELRGDIEDWEATLARGAYVLPRGKLAAGRISGGSFRFRRYDQGRRITYTPNVKWDGDAPLLDEVVVSFVQGTQLLVRLLEDGRLDAAAPPMSVNLDERLDEVGLAHTEAVGTETIAIEAAPGRLPHDQWQALVAEIDVANLVRSFIRDDGSRVRDERGRKGPLPAEISIAAPEGDELLGLMQRAVQLDLQRSDVTSQLISGPLSTHYGAWRDDPPADLSLVRLTAGSPMLTPARTLEIARIETIVVWRAGIQGIVVNPTLDGPLWNAWEWWKDPSI